MTPTLLPKDSQMTCMSLLTSFDMAWAWHGYKTDLINEIKEVLYYIPIGLCADRDSNPDFQLFLFQWEAGVMPLDYRRAQK